MPSPCGTMIAVVEGVASDRGNVVGELLLIDVASGLLRRLDAASADVTQVYWLAPNKLLVTGVRGFESVIGTIDIELGTFRQSWASEEITTSRQYVSVAPVGSDGDCILVAEGFVKAPEIGRIIRGRYETILELAPSHPIAAGLEICRMSWLAADGLIVEGWLLRTATTDPSPLVMHVHGGPVAHYRPRWLGRGNLVPDLLLLDLGYAVFFPNPRGSSGRGLAYSQLVLGDMGGADADDLLSGIDHLIEAGLADPSRIGVTGGSYGGYMSCWLITRSDRFAAAVPVAACTNFTSQQLVSNIPEFVDIFLTNCLDDSTGRCAARSPIHFTDRVRTPTLNICGALDRCTPAAETVQFHVALKRSGGVSALATYPLEGHGIRSFPASVDYAARVLSWFTTFMPASPEV